jgi:hypothetical protein
VFRLAYRQCVELLLEFQRPTGGQGLALLRMGYIWGGMADLGMPDLRLRRRENSSSVCLTASQNLGGFDYGVFMFGKIWKLVSEVWGGRHGVMVQRDGEPREEQPFCVPNLAIDIIQICYS